MDNTDKLKTFKFEGRVYFYNKDTKQKESMVTTITIQAPNSQVARAVMNNYGMESIKIKLS